MEETVIVSPARGRVERARAAASEVNGVHDDIVGRAHEFIPRGARIGMIRAAYAAVVLSIQKDMRSSRLILPALKSPAEVSRRLKRAFELYAIVRDSSGMDVSHQRAVALLPAILWKDLNGEPWDELTTGGRTFCHDGLQDVVAAD